MGRITSRPALLPRSPGEDDSPKPSCNRWVRLEPSSGRWSNSVGASVEGRYVFRAAGTMAASNPQSMR